MLKGLMQDVPLLISSLIEHAASCHPQVEVVSRAAEGGIHRCTYGDIGRRSKRLAQALMALGVKPGDRIGTLAWNGYRHFEMYFGVSGIGAVLHTIHPRQPPEQLEYVINHAEDRCLFFDVTFAPLIERLAPSLETVKHFVAMTDRTNLPLSRIPNLLCYEDLIAANGDEFDWPSFDETAASSLCYTAGTTGNPKGVLYSHRSTVLHAFSLCATDAMAISANEVAFLAAPMFYVNAWGVPYAAAMSGMKLVLPGPAHDAKSMYDLLRDERATVAVGAPHVWGPLFAHVDASHRNPRKDLRLKRAIVGGATPSAELLDAFGSKFGIAITQVWGMTEISPIGALGGTLPKHATWSAERIANLRARQGRPPYGVEMRLIDDDGRNVPHDGQTSGHLLVRGPWIASGYFRSNGTPLDTDGFLDTGDVGTIDPDGYLRVTDRAADAIRAGGDWMSSGEIESLAAGHPAVFQAVMIVPANERSRGRRLLLVLKRTDFEPTRGEILEYLAGRVDRRWLPDDVAFVDSLPLTATGKIRKARLREAFADHRWATDTELAAV